MELSPFFHKRNRKPPQLHSRSSHFVQSPSSALGSVRSLGSLALCLFDNGVRLRFSTPTKSLVDGGERYQPFSTLDDVVAHALRHFQCCSEFMKRWNENIVSFQQTTGPFEYRIRLDENLAYCARHLCPHRCYMRTFAPYRDWFSLCATVSGKLHDHSLDQVLDGWACILQQDPSFLPRTVFVSPQGNQFRNKQQVIKYLFCSENVPDRLRITYESKANRHISTRIPPYSFVGSFRSVESPFGLLEELFAENPWAMLLSTIFLNRTSRTQVDCVMYTFLKRWPSYDTVLEADVSELASVIQPLGMNIRRATGILRFCREYKEILSRKAQERSCDIHQAALSLTREEVLSLFQCGEYAYAAYRLFVQRDVSSEPLDRALSMYSEYKRGLRKTLCD